MTLSALLRRVKAKSGTPGRVAAAHGFRSAFRDWANESGYARDLAERALAHTVANKVEAAYRRTDLLEQRRPMMEAWAAHVCGQTGCLRVPVWSQIRVTPSWISLAVLLRLLVVPCLEYLNQPFNALPRSVRYMLWKMRFVGSFHRTGISIQSNGTARCAQICDVVAIRTAGVTRSLIQQHKRTRAQFVHVRRGADRHSAEFVGHRCRGIFL
jgi:hypothetical protein